MRKNIYTFMLLFVMAFPAVAQTVNDSVSIGTGYANAVFYRLDDGVRTSVSNTNWHLAFAVRPSAFPNNPMLGVVLRHNSQAGVKVYRVPGKTAADFNAALDTTGMNTWKPLVDTDSTWEAGAFNAGKSSNPFNFGWGTYDQISHDVTGDSLYLLKLPGNVYKKFIIEKVAYDTLWVCKNADLGAGSTAFTLQINKKAYLGKLFAYFDAVNNVAMDREPMGNSWDLMFARYAAFAVQGPVTIPDYPSTGVLANAGVTVAEARGVNKNTVSNAQYADKYSSRINEIGFDWKNPPAGPPPAGWTIVDSLCYFVKARNNMIYKIFFTGFSGSATGTYYFTKSSLATSVKEAQPFASSLSVYPNPAVAESKIVFYNEQKPTQQIITLMDINGRELMKKETEAVAGMNEISLDLSSLRSGLYIIGVVADGYINTQRIMVQ